MLAAQLFGLWCRAVASNHVVRFAKPRTIAPRQIAPFRAALLSPGRRVLGVQAQIAYRSGRARGAMHDLHTAFEFFDANKDKTLTTTEIENKLQGIFPNINRTPQEVADKAMTMKRSEKQRDLKNGRITAAEVESLAQQAAADMQKRAEKEQDSFDDFMAHLRKEFRLPEACDATPAPA